MLFFFFKDFIYFFDRDRNSQREREHKQGEWERKKQALIAEEPDMGLDPITPGSRPEPEADALTAVPPRRPFCPFLNWIIHFLGVEFYKFFIYFGY